MLSARQSAARGVDLIQVYTNFEIGRRIVEEEQQGVNRAQYGKEIIRELAARLTREFGSGLRTVLRPEWFCSNLCSRKSPTCVTDESSIAQTVPK